MVATILARDLKNLMYIKYENQVYRTEHVQRGCSGKNGIRVMRTVINPLLPDRIRSLTLKADDVMEIPKIIKTIAKVIEIFHDKILLLIDGIQQTIPNPAYAKNSIVIVGKEVEVWKIDGISVIKSRVKKDEPI